ncbi:MULTISPECIES: phage tail protein [Thalassospira]|uniref:Phage tail collar domain-containing protein n=2 Tax=Thalassospira tepidiphila TaxID=393657 RepID=A0A853KXS9_9PROT|nr:MULTISPECIES: phage tail protein [Thalassospira]MBO6581148.1 tail fiber protein [Thalassospira sp.]MBO6802718.1 tail fiber protein [Thalassospira sp.]MBO6819746.1 tail fiber protein [Thalassospira sp.]MBO6886558.1 tail fiber protein [Thalassospira sp.]NJB75853.1 phage-related tail fiber protein [Thalassospira tepidiphila]
MQGNTPVECEVLNVIQGAGIWPDCDDKTQLLQAIEALIAGGGSGGGGVVAGSEIGSVSAFAMPTPPTGWLVCDGSAISRTEYADLFATIGTLWGAGDEVSTFNLPDLRGEFLRGFDAGRGVDEGRVFGSFQGDQMQGHEHNLGELSSRYYLGNNSDIGGPESRGPHPTLGIISDGVNGEPRIGIETRPRNITMTYAIKAFYPTSA